jgi:hypothetical protein
MDTYGADTYGSGTYGGTAASSGTWQPVLAGSTAYPELLVEWAPTTLPTDTSQTYEDITDRLRDWSWGYGRNDELGRFEAGSGYVLLDNRDRALDPSYNAGAWYGNIKPRKMFRLRARWDSTIYPVFVAYSRGFPQTYPADGFDGVVKVELVDAFAILQGFDLVAGFTRPAERTDERIDAVLEAAGIPSSLRDLDVGTRRVAAIEITESGTSGLDHAKTVAAEAEFGQLFVAKDGRVTFHNRSRRLNQTSGMTFSDATGATLPYQPDFEPQYDDTYLWNTFRVAGPDTDDVPGEASDATSLLDYHPIVRPVASQLTTFSERQALAEYQNYLYAQPALRLPTLPLNGAGAKRATLWPAILGLEVSDPITTVRYGNSGDPMSLEQNVEGIRHSCRPGGPWTTIVAASPRDTTVYWEAGVAGKSEAGTTTVAAP